MWTKRSRRHGRTDAMLRSVVLCRIVPCGPRQQGRKGMPWTGSVQRRSWPACMVRNPSCFLPGKDGFRAPAHGIPGVMWVSPCGTRGWPSNTDKEIRMPGQAWLAGRGLAGELLRPVTGGGFGQTGRRRLRRAHVDRFFWCLGGTAVRSPGQSVVPPTQSAGRALFFCSGRCGLRTMAAALLGCMPLRTHSHRRHAAERDSASAGRSHGPYRRHRRRADPAAGLLVCCSPLPGGCCPHAGCCLVHDGSDISVGPPVRSCARERGRDDGSPYPVRKVKFTGGWAGSRLPHDRIGGSGKERTVLPVCSLLSSCLACGKGIGYIIKGVTEALSFSGYSLFKGDC